jgi:hypothetical protein
MLKKAAIIMSIVGSTACGGAEPAPVPETATAPAAAERPYLLELVDDAAIVQIYADGFEHLPLKEKTLVWHLYQAALAGRDIYYDQRFVHNLEMRDVLEAIVAAPKEPTPEAAEAAGISIRRPTPRSCGTRSSSGSIRDPTTT